MNMALNRYPQVRAALCDSETLARLARAHNDANVMVLGGRVSGSLVAEACLQAFTTTAFAAGRHARRVAKLSATPLEDIKT
jgi:ribose 5-phosphate isomerase B